MHSIRPPIAGRNNRFALAGCRFATGPRASLSRLNRPVVPVVASAATTDRRVIFALDVNARLCNGGSGGRAMALRTYGRDARFARRSTAIWPCVRRIRPRVRAQAARHREDLNRTAGAATVSPQRRPRQASRQVFSARSRRIADASFGGTVASQCASSNNARSGVVKAPVVRLT